MKQYLYVLVLVCLVSEISYSQCKALRKRMDDNSSYITICSPMNQSVSACKVITGGPERYFLILTAPGSLASEQLKVVVLLANGQQFEWPVQPLRIQTQHQHVLWRSSALVATTQLEMTEEQINLLAQHSIQHYKLGTFERPLTEKQGGELRDNINCLRIAKPVDIKRSQNSLAIQAIHRRI
jgi:hypothetical protein